MNDDASADMFERQDQNLRELFPKVWQKVHKERKYDFKKVEDRKTYNERVKELI